ncbi:MAG: DnaJ domain-containing protein [Rickettsiales bacterium]|nr:DnaJ domain-containing protein [Rickettsiales bacterium]
MATKSKKNDYVPHIDAEKAPPCSAEGCAERGGYKAPKSRDSLGEYQWFCLDHIREYNQKWDYFAGVGPEEIEYFVKDSVTGHRPTWSRENRIREQYHKLQDVLYEFLSGGPTSKTATPPGVNGKVRRALAALDIEYPYTEQALKTQYRVLVKKFHPDVNKGDKNAEERFKQIASAYTVLTDHLKKA